MLEAGTKAATLGSGEFEAVLTRVCPSLRRSTATTGLQILASSSVLRRSNKERSDALTPVPLHVSCP